MMISGRLLSPKIKKAPPPKGWNDPKTQSKNTPKHNYGILTGKRNKLIVLDVDSKDDGVKELQKYLREHGALNTYTVSTPSGGFHYYFNYDPQNYLMTTYLTNRTKYRNCGLDIRTNGGYVVGAGSVVDGRAYEIHNRAPIGDMPDSLITWLIESFTSESVAKSPVTKRPPKCYSQPNAEVKYVVHDHELDSILSLLPENTPATIPNGCTF